MDDARRPVRRRAASARPDDREPATALHPDGDWHLRRFRANLVVDVAEEGWIEDAWCGRSILRIGAVQLQPEEPCIRCTMVTRAQTDLAADRDIFHTIARHHGGRFGAWTAVVTGGTVRVGDEVSIEPTVVRQPGDELLIGVQRRSDEEERRAVDLA